MPAIVVPRDTVAIPLAPEFVTPQDGSKKQDCGISAAKRRTGDFRRRHKKVSATLLGDDLYSGQPMCEKVPEKRLLHICIQALVSSDTI